MTAQRRHLNSAPIAEALVDFRVPPLAALPPDIDIELRARVTDLYPDMTPLEQAEAELQIVRGAPAALGPTRQIMRGFAVRSGDGQRIGQFRTDGFTFNRLRPYVNFEEMWAAARGLWRVYIDTFHPESITRVALRYINHLGLPAPVADLSRYLTAPPMPPPGLERHHQITGFLARVATIDPQTGISANVTQALEQSLQPGQVTVILDIDVYRMAEYEVLDARLDGILQALREMKNSIFFASITEDAAELWQ